MRDVVLATGQVMPHGPAAENPVLLDALAARGADAAIEPWGTAAATAARLVVIRTTWDYTDRLADFLTWAREAAAVTHLVNPADVVTWNSHKSYLIDLTDADVPVVATTLLRQGASRAERSAALELYDGEVVVKPAVAVGADRTIRVDAAAERAAEHLRDLAVSGDALVQPFEPAVLGGESSLIYFGRDYSHAVRKVPAAGDFRVHVFYGGVVEPHEPTRAERQVAEAALSAVPHDLAYARVDLVTSERGPVLMELELIEPQLFLDQPGESAQRFADHLIELLDRS